MNYIRVLTQEIENEYRTYRRKFDKQSFGIINFYFIKRYYRRKIDVIFIIDTRQP